MIPTLTGSKTVVAKFQSKELHDVDGYKVINVASNSARPVRADGPPPNDFGNGRNGN